MTKVKVGGIVLGGLAGYLILSKGINMVGGCVRNICESRKWKNYYKYGKEGNMVPPGYSMHTSRNDGTQQDTNKNGVPASKPAQNNAADGLGNVLGDVLVKAINNVFVTGDKQEEASEGETDGIQYTTECPHDCLRCSIAKEDICPYKHLRPNGGIITEWSEDGKPVAGAYPFNEQQDIEWNLYDAKNPKEEDEQTHEPLHVVKDGDGDTDGDKESFLNKVDPVTMDKIRGQVGQANEVGPDQPKEEHL